MTTKSLKLTTVAQSEKNKAALAKAFPNCVKECKDADGNITLSVDFDLLRQELSEEALEGSQERYRLDWPGKRRALASANTPTTKTLRPQRDESKLFDTTENLFIEGDNLEALKLLQETYLGRVKMIYIDPPYNTGKDFVYRDNFKIEESEYLEESGQSDQAGARLVANSETNGRYHSDWLSMMYPRLKLARNLLKDDGVIFISIDDHEQAALKHLCDEVFGSSNALGTFVWKRRSGAMDAVSNVSEDHEYVLCYSKSTTELNGIARTFEKYKNPDNDPRGDWISDNLSAGKPGGDTLYEIEDPETGHKFWPPKGRFWPYSRVTMASKIKEGRVLFPSTEDGTPMLKRFKLEAKRPTLPVSTWIQSSAKQANQSSLVVPMNSSATKQLSNLLGGKIFSFPKPVELVESFLSQATDDNDIVLDFFAGSATTAHACMQVNARHQKSLQFILVQLPEKTTTASEAHKAGYLSIADISKERIRRAGEKILEEYSEPTKNLDVGFRVLKVDSSNMNDVFHSPSNIEQISLLDTVEHIKPDRSEEDLLFQVMLAWGVDLSLPIVRETIEEKSVFWVGENDLAACFDLKISESLVQAMAEKKPLRAVFRDDGFNSDDMKINAGQLFKQMTDSHTDMKVI